jgi:predicted glycosyltransferase involved in capsule biosynthesis
MLYDLPSFRGRLGRDYTIDDITVIIGVRAHAENPWLFERLEALAGYYEPAPRLLLVDFGSAEPLAGRLRESCARGGVELLRVEDDGVFSPGIARNRGATHASTELLFFSDIDCLGERDLFERLLRHANALELGARFDLLIDLPVYHLSEVSTARFFALNDAPARSRELARAMVEGVTSAAGSVVEYVDPQSNFFLVRRDFFDYLGGFNECFRGHGSEDFEFLLRFALYSQQFPVPARVAEDGYRPNQDDFFGRKQFRGFRRLFELIAEPAQLAGLRIAHLHHARRKEGSDWYGNNDWSRTRFSEQVTPYLRSRAALLDYDWMPRARRAVVLVERAIEADMFFPLRCAGYRLTSVLASDPASLAQGRRLLEGGEVDTLAGLASGMSSNVALRELFELSRRKGLHTLLVQPGVLPESWLYGSADAVPLTDVLAGSEFTAEELSLTAEYAEGLRASGVTAAGELSRAMLATLLWRRYSFFRGVPAVWYHLNLGASRSVLRARLELPVAARSYVAARMGIGAELAVRGESALDWCELQDEHASTLPAARSIARMAKLLRNPRRFCEQSRFAALRAAAPLLPDDHAASVRWLRELAEQVTQRR